MVMMRDPVRRARCGRELHLDDVNVGTGRRLGLRLFLLVLCFLEIWYFILLYLATRGFFWPLICFKAPSRLLPSNLFGSIPTSRPAAAAATTTTKHTRSTRRQHSVNQPRWKPPPANAVPSHPSTQTRSPPPSQPPPSNRASPSRIATSAARLGNGLPLPPRWSPAPRGLVPSKLRYVLPMSIWE